MGIKVQLSSPLPFTVLIEFFWLPLFDGGMRKTWENESYFA
jgi:hypothetical protein